MQKNSSQFFYVLRLFRVFLLTQISYENEGEYILKKKSKIDAISVKDAHKTIYILPHYKTFNCFCNNNT